MTSAEAFHLSLSSSTAHTYQPMESRIDDADTHTSGSVTHAFEEHRSFCDRLKAVYQRDPLLVQTAAAVTLGLGIGFALVPADMSEWLNTLIGLPGSVFLRLLKLIVVPLVCGSITGSLLHMRRMTGGVGVARLTRRVLGIYLATYLIAMATGMTLVNVIEPGGSVTLGAPTPAPTPGPTLTVNATLQERVAALEARFAPKEDNDSSDVRWQCRDDTAAESLISKQKSKHTNILDSFTNVVYGMSPTNVVSAAATSNILGLIVVAAALGVGLPVGTGKQPLTGAEKAVAGLNDIIGQCVRAILKVSPVCIGSLIAAKVTSACDVSEMFRALGKFILTVVLGLGLHGLVWLPAVFFAVTKRNPLVYFRQFGRALLTAFAIASSAATLPVNISCAEAYGVDHDLASFVLVLGATVNMDGTAMYEAVCALFIAQLHGRTLGFADQVIVAVTGSLAAVGAAAIPSAGLVTLVMVLQAVDMTEYAGDIAYILVVDWLLDRVRTAVNVLGDGVCVCLVHHLSDGAGLSPRGRQPGREMEGKDGRRKQPFSVGDCVLYDTAEGRVGGGVVRGGDGDRFAVEEADGEVLSGWRSDWLTHDQQQPQKSPRLHRPPPGSPPKGSAELPLD
eukprot:TRINITY_DN6620_c0_g1_i1.p1 TRINITY_DN6620_c0_g1~~TRINITY_DN6620_c0_g1_i1.p1  ORF type:complete len:620 (+),score=146.00 TRINITY_DN6620_c0_g1_i1:88-1947(+)